MGASTIGEITEALMDHGLSSTTPVLAITSATTPNQRRKLVTLGTIAAVLAGETSGEPTLFIIGNVVALMEQPDSLNAVLNGLQAHHVYALA